MCSIGFPTVITVVVTCSLGHTSRLTAVKRLGATFSKNLYHWVALQKNINSEFNDQQYSVNKTAARSDLLANG